MLKLTNFILFILFAVSYNTNAMDTLSCKYFPMKIGNTLYYKKVFVQGGNSDTNYSVTRILDTNTINGKKYFIIQNFIWLGTSTYKIRYDSTNGDLKIYDSTASACGYELKMFKLAANLNDTMGKFCSKYHYLNIQQEGFYCNGIGKILLFTDSVNYKKFYSYWDRIQFSSTDTRFAMNFGIYYLKSVFSSHPVSYQGYYYLIGAKINGIVFGDTNNTNVQIISLEIPSQYNLSQNHPNPFNPVTTIKFDIPKTSDVKMIIYDITGRELETTVNDKLSAGSYSVNWYGGNYSSGIYFYKLIAEGYTDTKRMVLIK